MSNANPEQAEISMPIDAGKCIGNILGLARMGSLSGDEIADIIAKRDSVGKRSRSRYGRLLCEFEGCEVACNVELEEGIPVPKGMGQLFKLLEGCVVCSQTTVQPGDGIS